MVQRDNMKEEWRWVAGYESFYMISNKGRLKSFHKRSLSSDNCSAGKILSAPLDTSGYPRVSLNMSGAYKKYRIHELVAFSFIGPRKKGMVIRHLDGDSENNNVENLCYGTYSENTQDSIRHGTYQSGRMKMVRLSKEVSEEIRRLYIPREVTMKEIAKMYGIAVTTVFNVLKNLGAYKVAGKEKQYENQ